MARFGGGALGIPRSGAGTLRGAGVGVTRVLGGKTTSSGQTPTAQFSSPFFNFKDGNLTNTALADQGIAGLQNVQGQSSALLNRFESLRGGLGERRASLGQLLNLVTPGEGRLSAAVRTTFQNQLEGDISNIRGEISSRGIPLGSSILASAVAPLLTQAAQDVNFALAEVFLQEIGLAAGIIEQQLGVDRVEAEILAQEIAPIKLQLDATNSLLDFGIQSGSLAAETALGFAEIAARFAAIQAQQSVSRSRSISFAPTSPGIVSRFNARIDATFNRTQAKRRFVSSPGTLTGRA